jgi:hypothetical protein
MTLFYSIMVLLMKVVAVVYYGTGLGKYGYAEFGRVVNEGFWV